MPDDREKFKAAFGEDHPTWANALRAVTAYQTLNSKNVPFDAFPKGNDEAVNTAVKRRHKPFTGEANCVPWHDGGLLPGDCFHNLGVPASPGYLNGQNKQITSRFEQASNGVPRKLDGLARDDLGLYYVTKGRGRLQRPLPAHGQ